MNGKKRPSFGTEYSGSISSSSYNTRQHAADTSSVARKRIMQRIRDDVKQQRAAKSRYRVLPVSTAPSETVSKLRDLANRQRLLSGPKLEMFSYRGNSSSSAATQTQSDTKSRAISMRTLHTDPTVSKTKVDEACESKSSNSNRNSSSYSESIMSQSTIRTSQSTKRTLSEEQKAICEAVCVHHSNVVVIAKAGSGKTTLCLETARTFCEGRPDRKCLVLTYNRSLKDETRQRIHAMGLRDAVEAHSFHAFAATYFGGSGSGDDAMIERALTQPDAVRKPYAFDIIFVDECQDMIPLYHRLVVEILKGNEKRSQCQLVMLGDPFQQIYRYKGALLDYMERPQHYFGALLANHRGAFRTMHMTVCWRITHEMAGWINAHVNPTSLPELVGVERDTLVKWWGRGIRANPARGPEPYSVEFRRVNGWNPNADDIEMVATLFETHGMGGCALIAPSLKTASSGKKSTPVRAFVNATGEAVPWCVLSGESGRETNREDYMRNKYVASTIHKFKGLERDAILFFGFDAFQDTIVPNDARLLAKFNLMYVACTRARKKLVVVYQSEPFITHEFRRLKLNAGHEDKKNGYRRTVCVTELVENTPFDPTLVDSQHFNVTPIATPPTGALLRISKSDREIEGQYKGTCEDVARFMGVAVEQMIVHRTWGQSASSNFALLLTKHQQAVLKSSVELAQFFKSYTLSRRRTWHDMVRYAIAIDAVQTGYLHLWRQIPHPEEWLNVPLMERCYENVVSAMKQLLNGRGTIANRFSYSVPCVLTQNEPWWTDRYEEKVHGIADFVLDGHTAVELKMSNEPTYDHMHQVLCYQASIDPSKRPVLILTTGQAFGVTSTFALDRVFSKLCRRKIVDY